MPACAASSTTQLLITWRRAEAELDCDIVDLGITGRV